MDWKLLISILSVFLSAWALLNTRHQFVISHRPDLFIQDKTFSVSINDIYAGKAKSSVLDVYNIGLGSAKHLKIEWNVEKFIGVFQKAVNLKKIKIVLNEGKLFIKPFAVMAIDEDFDGNYELTKKINFLMPYGATKQCEKLVIPPPIIYLFNKYGIFASKEITTLGNLIKIKLSYQDERGKTINKNYKANFEWVGLGGDDLFSFKISFK